MKKFIKSASLLLVLIIVLINSVCVFADELPMISEPYVYDPSTGEFIIYDLSAMGFSSLPAGVFQGMESMIQTVEIKDKNIKVIEQSAFLNCFRLKKVYIPESVEVIEEGAFWGCPDDLKIYAPRKSAGEFYAKDNGYTFKEFSGETKDTKGSVAEGGYVTVLGLGIVFLILIILCIVLKVFEMAFGPAKKTNAPSPIQAPKAPAPVQTTSTDETELVAVISAAIAASLGTCTSSFRIKSLRRLGSTWNQAAKLQNFNNNF